MCKAEVDISGPKKCPGSVSWQRLEVSSCEKTSFFRECQMNRILKIRNKQIQEWNKEVAKKKGEAKTKLMGRGHGKNQMQKAHIFYNVEEKTREILACQRPGCSFNKRRPPKRQSGKTNAAGVKLYVDQSFNTPGPEMQRLLDETCEGGEMEWETMEKEDNGKVAPESLLTAVELAAVDNFDPSTKIVKKGGKKR